MNAVQGVSVDCPDLNTLAVALRINTNQPGIFSDVSTDCCLASGIICNGNRVIEIVWNQFGLGGYIDGPSLSGLTSLQSLCLHDNQLTGNLPTLPSGIVKIELHGNLLTGNLPIFPISLITIYLGMSPYVGNQLTGRLVANRPYQLVIYGNLINDIVVTDTDVLSSCDISKNAVLGNPNINNLLSKCTNDNLVTYIPPVVTTTKPTTTIKVSTSTSKAVSTTTTTSKRSTIFSVTSTSTLLKPVTSTTTTRTFSSPTTTTKPAFTSIQSTTTVLNVLKTSTSTQSIKTTSKVQPITTTTMALKTISTYDTQSLIFLHQSQTFNNGSTISSAERNTTLPIFGAVKILNAGNNLEATLTFTTIVRILINMLVLGGIVAKAPTQVRRDTKTKTRFGDNSSVHGF